MSAPRTNIETQKRWHRAPLIGMIAVVIFALALLFVQMVLVAEEGTPQDNGAAEIDGRTGQPVPDSVPPAGDVPVPATDLPPAEVPTPAPDVEVPAPSAPEVQVPPAPAQNAP
jgi:hypothetical protein